jgi:hypothetical protein
MQKFVTFALTTSKAGNPSIFHIFAAEHSFYIFKKEFIFDLRWVMFDCFLTLQLRHISPFLILLSAVEDTRSFGRGVTESGINVRLSLDQDRAEETSVQELGTL